MNRLHDHQVMIASANPATPRDPKRIIRRQQVDIVRVPATGVRSAFDFLHAVAVHVRFAIRLFAGVVQVNVSPLLQLMDEP